MEGDPAPGLSIAMSTFNGARFLDRQLATILAQTALPTELVVGDDGSTDATGDQLRAFAASAPFPVRIQINRERLGAAANFGACVARCIADVIVLTDQDDLWEPDRLARTRDAFAADPELSYTFSDAPLIDDEDRPIGRTIFDSVPLRHGDRARLWTGRNLFPTILRYGVLYGATMAVRRRDALRVLPVPSLWSHDEWLSLALSAVGRSARLGPVTRYRQHATQVVGAGDAQLTTTIRSARARTAGHYIADADRQRAGLAAAMRSPALANALAPSLRAKLRFIEARQRLHLAGATGIPHLLREIGGGGYGRFGGGARSIMKDMLLMMSRPRRHD